MYTYNVLRIETTAQDRLRGAIALRLLIDSDDELTRILAKILFSSPGEDIFIVSENQEPV